MIWYLYTLDDHNKSTYHLLPFKIIMILLTIFPILYMTSPYTDNFREKQDNKFVDI